MKECCRPCGGRTRNLLITSRTHIPWFLERKVRLPYLPLVFGQTGPRKQCRPRSDAADCVVWSGSTRFATHSSVLGRPRWLSWMHRPTGDQEVEDSTLAEVGNILSWRLIMTYFLRSFFPFCWFKKDSLSVSGERMCTILVNRLED